MDVTQRLAQLGAEGAFVTFAAAQRLEREGRHIAHLEIGQPDFGTPPHVVEAAERALREGKTKYTPSPGIPELRAGIATYLQSTRNIHVDPEQVIVTPGAKNSVFCAMAALIEPGAEVLIPDPGFPAYEALTRLFDGVPVSYPLDDTRGFTISADAIASRITPRTRVLVLNSPHNPTGGVITDRDLEAIAEVVIRNNLSVVADDIYADLQYDGKFKSIFTVPGLAERTLIADGFSKNYAMTGWRLGYVVVPPKFVEPVSLLITMNVSCTATFVQWAGLAALQGPQEIIGVMRREYAARAELVVNALNSIPGVKCNRPAGAFYAFPDVRGVLSNTGGTSADLANTLLQEHGVACLAGTAFGAGGAGFLRLAYATSRETLTIGLERIRQCLAALPAAV